MVLDATPTRLRLSAQTEVLGSKSPENDSVACLQFLPKLLLRTHSYHADPSNNRKELSI